MSQTQGKTISDEEFKKKSAALASGEKKKVVIPVIPPVNDTPRVKGAIMAKKAMTPEEFAKAHPEMKRDPAKDKAKEKPAKVKKEPKVKEPKIPKPLTIHQNWLIDIRRFAVELGIKEGQVIKATVTTKDGAKALLIEF